MIPGAITTTNKNQSAWFLFFFVFVLFSIRILYTPDSFADFDSYVDLTWALGTNDSYDGFLIEPLSKLSLYWSGRFFPDHTAVSIIGYTNTLIFAFFFCKLVRRRPRNAVTLVLLVGLYVPLMAFVALRAMPAYLIAAFAIEMLWERRYGRAILYCLVATLFHFSAVLLLPSILLTIYLRKEPEREQLSTAKRTVRTLFVVTISIFLWLGIPSMLSAGMGGLIPEGSLLSKYSAYLLDENASSITHVVYFLFVNSVVAMFFYLANTRQQRTFAWATLFVFSVLSFSPVVAFRYSPYCMLPILLNFPMGRPTYLRMYFSLVLVVAGIVIFFAGISQIILR